MDWHEIAKWLWGLLIPAGWALWKSQDRRLVALETAMENKPNKADVDKALEDRRQDIKDLYKLNTDLRTDMMGGFSQLKDLIHAGNTDILRELSKKADK